MTKHTRTNGIRNNRVGVDGGYGKEPDFLRSLNSIGVIFMADIHKGQRIYLENPEPTIPESKSNRGRKPTKLKEQSTMNKFAAVFERDGDWWIGYVEELPVANTRKPERSRRADHLGKP